MGRSVGPPSFLGERDSTRSIHRPTRALFFFFLSSIVSECAVYSSSSSSPARSVAPSSIGPSYRELWHTRSVSVHFGCRSCQFFNVIKFNVRLVFCGVCSRFFVLYINCIGRSCQILRSFTLEVAYFPLRPRLFVARVSYFPFIFYFVSRFLFQIFFLLLIATEYTQNITGDAVSP